MSAPHVILWDEWLSGWVVGADTAVATLTLTPSSEDVADYVESATEVLALTPSAVDITEDVDASTEVLALTPSATEAAQFADASTEPLTLTPSSVDTAQYVDANTETLALTPSSTDIAQDVETATENLALTPSAAETAQYVDVSIVETYEDYLTYSGVGQELYGVPGVNDAIGQTFTPVATEKLSYVDLLLFKVGTPSDNLSLDVYATSGGFPTGPSLGTVSIAAGSFTSGLNARFTFPSPISLSSGTVYALVLTRSGSHDLANFFMVGLGTAGGHYSGGNVIRSTSGSFSATARDFTFALDFLIDVSLPRLTFTPSATETAQFVDVNTERLALTPSSTDFAEYVDTAIEYLSLSSLVGGVTKTFGSANISVGSSGLTTDTKSGTKFTLTDPALVYQLSCRTVPNIAGVVNYRMGIYTDSGGQPSTLVASTEVKTLDGSDAGVVTDYNLLVPAYLPPGDYWIVIQTDNGDARTVTASSFSAGISISGSSDTFSNGFDSTWVGSPSHQTRTLVMWATYVTTPEYAAFTDPNTILLSLTPSAVEIHEYTDAETEVLALTPSSMDTAQYVDAVTETLALTPSATEGITHADSRTFYQYLIPSGTTFVDDFNDNTFDPKWSNLDPSKIKEQNQQLEFVGAADTSAVRIEYNRNSGVSNNELRGESAPASCGVKVADFDNSATGHILVDLSGMNADGDNGSAEFSYDGTTLRALISNDSGNGVANVPTTISGPVWLRHVRTYPGIACQYSTDGINWTTLASIGVDYRWMNRTFFIIQVRDASKGPGTLIAAFDDFFWNQSVVEYREGLEAATFSLALTPSASDTTQYVDAATEFFTLTPSGTDTYGTATGTEYSDAETAIMTFTPIAIEVEEAEDTGVEVLVLTPSAMETVAANSDAATVVLSLTPSAFEFVLLVELIGRIVGQRYSVSVGTRYSITAVMRYLLDLATHYSLTGLRRFSV